METIMNFSFDVLSQIASGTNLFSESENRLAQYILTNAASVLNLSIEDLARECNVSVATVSRFCRRLSLNGYREFRTELVKSVTSASNNLTQKLTSESSIDDIISKIDAVQCDAIHKAALALDPKMVTLASDYIQKAADVHFMGCGNSQLVAQMAKHQFMNVSRKFHCESDPTFHALATSLMTPQSAAVIFSYSGSTRDIVEIAHIARERGAKIIAVTRYETSPLTELCDAVIICGVSEGPFQSGSSAVMMANLYIIDVLYTEYCCRNLEESTQNKEKTSAAVLGKIQPLR